jgi:acyl-CoA hydrolase
VARGDFDRGFVLGGSGNGEAIVANKVRGIRCALCWSVETAELARKHNDANVISIGQRVVDLETALAIVRTALATPFEAGRHLPRVQEIGSIETASVSVTAAASGFLTHEKTLLIRPEFLNHAGGLFGGYMMQWADDLAFNAASLTFPGATFVTRRFDAFDFTAPVSNGDIIKIFARVERVGTTSCQVAVWCLNARTRVNVFSTTAVMVNIGKAGAKTPIPR